MPILSRKSFVSLTSLSQSGRLEVMMMIGSCSWRFTLAVNFELTNSAWRRMGWKQD